jgi:nitrite reductase (NO-forming)
MHSLSFLRSMLCASMIAASFATTALAAPPSPRIVTPNAAPVQTDIPNVKPFNAVAPPQPEKGKVVNFTLAAEKAKMGEKTVWTFNGQVPAPTLRVHQGDTVHVTLINKDPDMAHGIDIHAGKMDMGTYHQTIKPGESESFSFVANTPGVFYYHCSAAPVIMHIANGMFGAVIVDPPGYVPQGKEYVVIQNEWYKNGQDLNDLENGEPESVAFNGVPSQYMNTPLTASAGEDVRFYFVNAGINHFSAFHVIGTIFDKVLYDGNPQNTFYGEQTVAVPPGGAIVADLAADKGTYALLSHSMKDAQKGALGLLKVGDAIGGSAATTTTVSSTSSSTTSSDSMASMPSMSSSSISTIPTTSTSSSTSTSATSSAPTSSATTVHLSNFAFSPNAITVKAGTKVTWVNDDDTTHSVVGDSFKSSDLTKGSQFSYTFTTPGTYNYKCGYHPFMTGTVTVN